MFPFLQYADDGALPLDGCNSLQNALNIISNFEDVSGLKMNLNKTEIILLGPSKVITQTIYLVYELTGHILNI